MPEEIVENLSDCHGPADWGRDKLERSRGRGQQGPDCMGDRGFGALERGEELPGKDETTARLILEVSDSLLGEYAQISSHTLQTLEGVEGPEGYP